MSRKLYCDNDGKLDTATISDDETCIILSSDAWTGLSKLLMKQSRDSLKGYGLTDAENDAVGQLNWLL